MSVVAFAVINVIGRLLRNIHHAVLCSAQFGLNVILSVIILICTSKDSSWFPLYSSLGVPDVLLIVLLGLSRTFSTILFVRAC